MAITTRKLTYDDLEAIPQEREGDRHEIINGALVVTPSPIPHHQDVSGNIFFALQQVVRAQNLGKVYSAPIDIRFTPDNVLIPDIIFITQDRLHVIGPTAVDAPPDLVVEILSPGTRRRDLTIKRDLYAQFGVREYWVVDPDARTLSVMALASDKFEPVPGGEGDAIASRVLPGLTLAVKDVFTGVEQ